MIGAIQLPVVAFWWAVGVNVSTVAVGAGLPVFLHHDGLERGCVLTLFLCCFTPRHRAVIVATLAESAHFKVVFGIEDSDGLGAYTLLFLQISPVSIVGATLGHTSIDC